jgi:hypothetical protein
MTSATWLKIYGLQAQKLDFFSILQQAAFRKCEGMANPSKSSPDNAKKADDGTSTVGLLVPLFVDSLSNNDLQCVRQFFSVE